LPRIDKKSRKKKNASLGKCERKRRIQMEWSQRMRFGKNWAGSKSLRSSKKEVGFFRKAAVRKEDIEKIRKVLHFKVEAVNGRTLEFNSR